MNLFLENIGKCNELDGRNNQDKAAVRHVKLTSDLLITVQSFFFNILVV